MRTDGRTRITAMKVGKGWIVDREGDVYT